MAYGPRNEELLRRTAAYVVQIREALSSRQPEPMVQASRRSAEERTR